MGLRAPWGWDGVGLAQPRMGSSKSPGIYPLCLPMVVNIVPHSQTKAQLTKEWSSLPALFPVRGQVVVNPRPQAVAIMGSSSSFLGPGIPGPHGTRICAHIRTHTPTHTITHTGSSSQTLRLKKASFKVELTSERGEDDVSTLEGFPVDRSGTVFLIFLLGDPHLLKGVQGGEDGAPNPCGIQSLLRCGYPDLHIFRSQFLHFTQ